jgi:hypothetical protein
MNAMDGGTLSRTGVPEVCTMDRRRTLNLLSALLLIAALLLPSLAALAQDTPAEPAPAEPAPAVEPTPEPDCATCHLDVQAEWIGTEHALAYQDPLFQDKWLDTRSDPACLACHTTNYVRRTTEFTHEGVACEACHGNTPANHPPAELTREVDAAACGDCHTSTYIEWTTSAHGVEGIACIDCHQPHKAGLIYESVQATCLNCHEELSPNYAHETHPDQQCVDCHWYKTLDKDAHFVTGAMLPTGHEGAVEATTCTDCHAENDPDFVVAVVEVADPHEGGSDFRAPDRPGEGLLLGGLNPATIQLLQGLTIGLGAGVFAAAVFVTSRMRRKHDQDGD